MSAAFDELHLDSDCEVIRRNGLLNVGVRSVAGRDGTIHALDPGAAMARHLIGLNQMATGIGNVGDGGLRRRLRDRAGGPVG